MSCAAPSEAFALAELREVWPDMKRPDWLEAGLALLTPGVDFETFAGALARRPPIFIRHIAPVQRDMPLRADESDLGALRAAALSLAGRLPPGATFGVQSRILAEGPLPYRKFTVNRTLSEALGARTGAVMDCRRPVWIVSVLCTPAAGYLGVSRAEQNLSDWPGGEHRFRREEGQISRAEFKLLEALDVFRLNLPTDGRALDMGAAPGGWTRVLRSRGLQVVAVDPAELDPRLRIDPAILPVRAKIEEYLSGEGEGRWALAAREERPAGPTPDAPPPFDLLVNDMRMDALDSVEIMLRARAFLKPGGLAVMTLKLPEEMRLQRAIPGLVQRALERLRAGYAVTGARQLYHNRSEVTVALRG
jgi:23S rRNA (cytidine2498-2'-O)-methyltransferase